MNCKMARLMLIGLLNTCLIGWAVSGESSGAGRTNVAVRPADPFVRGAVPVLSVARESGEAAVPPVADGGGTVIENAGALQLEAKILLAYFPKELIDSFARESDSAAPSGEQILNAWYEGKGRMIAFHKCSGSAGQEMVVQGASEHSYPRAFVLTPVVVGAGSNNSAEIRGAVVEPGNFETRLTGLLTTLVLDVEPEGRLIQVMSQHEYVVRLDDCEVGVSKVPGSLTQPVFFCQKVNVHQVVPSGKTVVSGGLLSPDGKELGYFLLTPRVMRAGGSAPGRRAET